MTQDDEYKHDDNWRNLDRRIAEPEEIAERFAYPHADPAAPFRDPGRVALTFIQALENPDEYGTALLNLTTPESHAAWGDFHAAASALAAIEDWGLGTSPTPAVGADDVVYAKILGGVTESFQLQAEEIVNAAALLTMVWRPEYGSWLVHAMGADYIKPEDLPRSAV